MQFLESAIPLPDVADLGKNPEERTVFTAGGSFADRRRTQIIFRRPDTDFTDVDFTDIDVFDLSFFYRGFRQS